MYYDIMMEKMKRRAQANKSVVVAILYGIRALKLMMMKKIKCGFN